MRWILSSASLGLNLTFGRQQLVHGIGRQRLRSRHHETGRSTQPSPREPAKTSRLQHKVFALRKHNFYAIVGEVTAEQITLTLPEK
jgi:hypothetical protein